MYNNNNLLILYYLPVQGSLLLLFAIYYNIVIARPPRLKDIIIKKMFRTKTKLSKIREDVKKRHPFVGWGLVREIVLSESEHD